MMQMDSLGRVSFLVLAARALALILIAIVLLLGYLGYQKVRERGAPQGAENVSETAGGDMNGFVFPPRTPAEDAILNPSASFGASEQDTLRYLESVAQAATAANTLAVGADCVLYPVALKTAEGMTVEVKNYDSAPHTLTVDTFSGARSWSVPAGGIVPVPVDFGESGSTYNITCDGRSAPVGMMLIVE